MTKRDWLGYFALTLAALTCAAAVFYWTFVPYTFRVAAPPADSEVSRFLDALSASLARDRAHVRLNIIHSEATIPTRSAFNRDGADLVVARTDQPLPATSLAVAQINEFVVVLMSRPSAKIERFADLRGKKLGVLERAKDSNGVLPALIAANNLPEKSVDVVTLSSPGEISDAVEEQKIDAVLAVMPRAGRGIALALQYFSAAIHSTPHIVPISEAAVLAARNPSFQAGEIAAGELGSTPQVPEKPVKTISFPLLLMARSDLSPTSVQELTKQLFISRQSLAATYPVAGRLAPLPTKRGSAFTVHPGAIVYYDAAETTFLSRYSDLLWLLLFGFGTLVSLGVWFLRILFPNQRELIRSEHGELVQLMTAIRAARTAVDIDNIEKRVDEITAHISSMVFNGKVDGEQQPAFDLLIGRISQIASEKREYLKN